MNDRHKRRATKATVEDHLATTLAEFEEDQCVPDGWEAREIDYALDNICAGMYALAGVAAVNALVPIDQRGEGLSDRTPESSTLEQLRNRLNYVRGMPT